MEEIVKHQIEQWAKRETIYRIALVLMAVIIIVSFMTKHFKTISEAMPSIRKALSWFQKKIFRRALFEKDLMDGIRQIKKEVAYNGGSITLSDAMKRIEVSQAEVKESQKELKNMVAHNKALRDITDLCSDRMVFRMNEKGGCFFINDAFLKLFGWQESDVMDYAFENIVHDDDVGEMRLKWTKAINTLTPFKDEQRIRDCHDVYHLCRVRAFPVIIDDELKEFSGTIDKI